MNFHEKILRCRFVSSFISLGLCVKWWAQTTIDINKLFCCWINSWAEREETFSRVPYKFPQIISFVLSRWRSLRLPTVRADGNPQLISICLSIPFPFTFIFIQQLLEWKKTDSVRQCEPLCSARFATSREIPLPRGSHWGERINRN